ncbi:MAG: hypothetical protein CJBNEKGG_00080 [Prosthecobacter sp.]|nr:hypothetical protein [Prosthecobacter sp.]
MTREFPTASAQGPKRNARPHSARLGSFGPWGLPWSLGTAHWAFTLTCPENDQGPGLPMTREFPTAKAQGTKRNARPHSARLGSFGPWGLPWSLGPAHWAFTLTCPENDQGPGLPMTREFPTTKAQGTKRNARPHSARLGSFGPWGLPWSLAPAHWAFLKCSSFLPPDGRKDQQQLIRLLPQGNGCGSFVRTSFHNHPHPVPRLLGLLFTGANFVHEFLFRNRLIRFRIVGPDACPASHKLADQRPGNAVFFHRAAELDHLLAKFGGSLLKVKNLLRPPLFGSLHLFTGFHVAQLRNAFPQKVQWHHPASFTGRFSRDQTCHFEPLATWGLPWSLAPAHWAFTLTCPENDQGPGLPMTREFPIARAQGPKRNARPHSARLGSFGPWGLPWSLGTAHWAFTLTCPENDQGPGLPMTREFPTAITQGQTFTNRSFPRPSEPGH